MVADSGAGSTIETFRNSELIFAIFKNFALKFSELTSIKVLENKALIINIVKTKNHIFHACQPREGIFEIRS